MIRDRDGCPVAELSGGALTSLCCVLFISMRCIVLQIFAFVKGARYFEGSCSKRFPEAGQAGAAGEESETVLRIFAFAIAFPAAICYNAHERRREGACDGAGKDDTV